MQVAYYVSTLILICHEHQNKLKYIFYELYIYCIYVYICDIFIKWQWKLFLPLQCKSNDIKKACLTRDSSTSDVFENFFWLIVIFKGKRSSSALQALPAWKKKQKQKQKHKNRVSLKTDYPNRHFCFLFLRDPCFKRLSFL